MCSTMGAGIVTFGTRRVFALRNAKARTIGLSRQRIGALIHSRENACSAPPWFLQVISVVPERSAERPQFITSSSHQLRRRNSPSVTARSPTRSCIAITSRMHASSTARNSASLWGPRFWSAVCGPSSRSRASLSFCGRSRLPTWSARNGGRERATGFVAAAVAMGDLPGGSKRSVGSVACRIDRRKRDAGSEPLRARHVGVGEEELLPVDLIVGDRLLAGGRDQPVDEGLAELLLHVRVLCRVHQDDAVLVEQPLVALDR